MTVFFMRICLFSKRTTSSNWLYQGVYDALRMAGHEVLDLNIPELEGVPPPHWLSIPTLKTEHPHEVDVSILETIEHFAPQQIWLLQYSGLPFLVNNGAALRHIVGKEGKILYWSSDLMQDVHDNTFLGGLLDALFFTDQETIIEHRQKWANAHIYFMPHGTIPSPTFEKPNESGYDIGFLGRRQTNDPRYAIRNSTLDLLKSQFRFIESDTCLTPSDVHRFYRNTRVGFAMSWKNDALLYSSDRIFHVLGSGTFCLHHYFPGIEKIFENKKHLVWFSTKEEALELARYYLHNPSDRLTVAKAGYALVIEKHTFLNRIHNIFAILSGKSDTFDGFIR